MTQMYPVYKIRRVLSLQDPDVPGTRYHTIIFVKDEHMGPGGAVHHVTGDITSSQGMHYELKRGNGERSTTFHSQELIGYTEAATHPQAWQEVLSRLPTPPKQKEFNMKTMKTEPFKTLVPLTFYDPGEDRKPLFKCTEWTETMAIPALLTAGLIRPASTLPQASSGVSTQPRSSSRSQEEGERSVLTQ
jgi:hypothetical protein